MEVTMNTKFNDVGQQVTITIQTKYADREVIRLPENCYNCPVGFQFKDGDKANCGRNVPFTDDDAHGRPETCLLKQLDLADIIGQLGVSTQMSMEYAIFKEKTRPKPMTKDKTCPCCGRYMGFDIESHCQVCGQKILIPDLLGERYY